MKDNLKIELFKTQLNDVISNSNLSVGIVYLVLKDILNELSILYNQQVNQEYQEYQQSLEKNKEKEDNQ